MAWAYLDVRKPLVAWLVYRGEMVSSNRLHPAALSIFHTERLRTAGGSQRYRTELAIEATRRQRFAEKVSRLQGFYVFGDRTSAERAAAWGGAFHPALLTEVGICEGSTVSRYDAQWISRHFETGPGEWISPYLAGEPSGDEPVWEQVVDGRALIYGTETRTRARSVVEQNWAESMGLLELSRLAVELESDLGAITAFAQDVPGAVQIDYIVNFADADDPQFLRRLGEYPGPRDAAALAQFSAGVVKVPDLSAFRFQVPLA